MKYWRGYLVAAILLACTWGLQQFAASHWVLVDMIYPYVTRMAQTFLAEWSGSLETCLWQVLLLVLCAGGLASVVLMIVLRWNPIQWFGWVAATVSLIILLHTGIYGLNQYAGPIADDIRLKVTDYTVAELEKAAVYYRNLANSLAKGADRDDSGALDYPEFKTLAEQAGDGFETLTYEEFISVFAGSKEPVKELGWSDLFVSRGVTGMLVPLTGEAAVNPQTPEVGLPFAMCRQMAKRMCIANEQDAALAAFMACRANSHEEYQYSGYFMAYRFCCNTLEAITTDDAKAALEKIRSGENEALARDLQEYNDSFAVKSDLPLVEEPEEATEEMENPPQRSNVTDLLVSLYIQEVVLVQQMEEEVLFNPLDETQVDLSGLPNIPEETEPVTNE